MQSERERVREREREREIHWWDWSILMMVNLHLLQAAAHDKGEIMNPKAFLTFHHAGENMFSHNSGQK